MDAIQMLLNRRSCRSYTKEQISDETLKIIIDCGLAAPSAMNEQTVKIVVVQEPEKVKFLSELNDKIWQQHTDPFYGAPTVCLILAPKNTEDIKESHKLNQVKDVGSCWINRCKEMLELPEGKKVLEELGLPNYFGIGCVILGMPDKKLGEKKIKEGRVIRY